MIELKKLSNEALLQEAKSRVEKERYATLATIECLEEVESRSLHLELGYSSLWSFCREFLGLSEGASQRRILAMRLGRKIPEAKQALQDGNLSLAVASKLQSFFVSEKKNGNDTSTEKTKQVIQSVMGMSQSECEKKLFEISPAFEVKQKEVLKPVSEDQSVLKLILESKVVDQLNLLKNRMAHTLPAASYTEIISYLIEDKLKQVEKKKGAAVEKSIPNTIAAIAIEKVESEIDSSSAATAIVTEGVESGIDSSSAATEIAIEPVKRESDSSSNPTVIIAEEINSEIQNLSSSPSRPGFVNLRKEVTDPNEKQPIVQDRNGIWSFAAHTRTHITAATDRELWKRSQGKCEYISAQGKRCCSTYALERDHIIPVSLGGTNELKNLKHLCKYHHRQSTVKVFGNGSKYFLKSSSRTSW